VKVRKVLTRVGRPFLLLTGAGAVAYLLYHVGPRAVWDSIRALGWGLPIVLLFPFSSAVILDTLGWRVLLRDHQVPWRVLLRARLAGEAVNLITPTASVGGEPIKAYLIRPYVPLSEGLASVVVDKTTVISGQVGLLLAAIFLASSMLALKSPVMVAMMGLCVVETLAIAGFIVVQMLGVFGGGGRALGRIGLGHAYQEGLDALDRRLNRFYRERRARLLLSACLHGIAWATGGLEIYLVLLFQGVDASVMTALVVDAFGAAIKFASFMIPASLGALEGGYVAIFGALGLGGALGLSYTLIRRLREVVWSALGLLWLATLRARPWAEQDALDLANSQESFPPLPKPPPRNRPKRA
jgi:glycosyltransferase 2 family protein